MPITGGPAPRRNVFGQSNSIVRWPMAEQALPGDFKEFLKLLNDADVRFISLRRLRENKRASGRHKDLDDLEHLPG